MRILDDSKVAKYVLYVRVANEDEGWFVAYSLNALRLAGITPKYRSRDTALLYGCAWIYHTLLIQNHDPSEIMMRLVENFPEAN